MEFPTTSADDRKYVLDPPGGLVQAAKRSRDGGSGGGSGDGVEPSVGEEYEPPKMPVPQE